MNIPYGRQNISKKDIQAVVEVLKSDYITQGPVVPEFEDRIAKYCGVKYAICVNSATSALHLACLALGIKNGDNVWTSPISFVASANCALYCGANIDFIDIDPITFNISVEMLETKLKKAEEGGKLPKLVIPVHLCGQSCDMEAIHNLSKKYGFKIIEDGSHAIGGSYKGMKIGNCKFSDAVVFSFHPVKIITTGEGGVVLTNDDQVKNKLAQLRSHGIIREAKCMEHQPMGSWYYEMQSLGYNYRMSDLQAALGLSQISRLDDFVNERNRLAEEYDSMITHPEITKPVVSKNCKSAYHLYVIRLSGKTTQMTQAIVFDRMKASGIGVNLHYIPIYRHPYYSQFKFNPREFPQAEKYYSEAITIPIFPCLSASQQKQVVATLQNTSGFQTIF
jgi:UDP-4-amino-4,6-dideoxy-N-acetyl-beta-L-altrosamine transaminase